MIHHEFSAIVAVGTWFRPAEGNGWYLVLAAVVASIAFLGLVRMSRVRSTNRWKAALDAYAHRQIARDRLRKASPQ